MTLDKKEITLKNGKTAILRSPEVSDAADLLNYIREACGETDYLIRYPEEYDEFTVEREEAFVNGHRESENMLLITCFVDGEIAGNCDIQFKTAAKERHRACIGIAILKKYWDLGIGSAMFRELLDAAQARGGVEIVELQFIEGNSRARALYEKFGFEVVCERPNAFKCKDGSLRKEYFMQKKL